MPVTSRAPYLGPEARRPLVVDAALEVFAERGFAATSMNDVAERSAVSKAVLYDCFPGGKRQIFSACIRTAAERLDDARKRWAAEATDGASIADLVVMLADIARVDMASFRLLCAAPAVTLQDAPLVSLLIRDLSGAGVSPADVASLRFDVACLVAIAIETSVTGSRALGLLLDARPLIRSFTPALVEAG